VTSRPSSTSPRRWSVGVSFIPVAAAAAQACTGAQTILNQAGKDGQSLAPILTSWAKRHAPPSPLKLLLWFQRQVHIVPTEVADHVSTHDEGPSGYKVLDNKGFVLHSHDGRSVLLELLAIPMWLQRKLSHALSPFTAEPTAFDPWLAYNNVPKWGELTQEAAYEAYLAEWHERRKRYPTFEWPHGRKLLLELDLTKCSQRVMRDALSCFLSRQSIEWWTALFDASPHKISELDRWAVDKVKAIDKLEEEMYQKASSRAKARNGGVLTVCTGPLRPRADPLVHQELPGRQRAQLA
jgi:hypothetical protein